MHHPILETNMMIVVVAVKGEIEFTEAEASSLLGISFGLLNFSNQSRIHGSVSFRI
jgi:hypothetical protein